MNIWKKIWNKRDYRTSCINLDELIKADGFDMGAGRFDENKWVEYVTYIAEQASIESTQSIFEVGCGAGAFLYPLYKKNHRVSGLDYSMSLIEIANRIMPGMNFINCDACSMDINKRYDIVISNSVFQYFDNLEYARKVIDNMLAKANTKVLLLDINDKCKESESIAIRKEILGDKEYKSKYSTLKHLFYEKDWFRKIANQEDYEVEIFDQNIEGYINSGFRFNVVFTKKVKVSNQSLN